MCDLFGSKLKTENLALKNDILTIYDLARYLAREVERPPKKAALTSTARGAIANLEFACDLGAEKYVAPDGMLYRCTGTDISNILKKYSLDDSWMRLDAIYHVPRWDYMQLLYLWDWIDTKAYVAETFDCDDFGLTFKGHMAEYADANGVMWVIDWSGGHSYNMVFDIQITNNDPLNPIVDVSKSKAIILEPQSDQWEPVPMIADEQGGTKVPEDYIPLLKAGMYPLKNCKLIM